MGIPANYDAVTMAVEPGQIMTGANGIKSAAEDIIAALNVIDNTLTNLQLGWDGDTAAEAQDFSDQWLAAMTGLFGSEKEPQNGVMNQVIIALMTAAANYSNGEEGVVKMFATLQAELMGGALSTPAANTAPIPAGTGGTFDMSLTAITEVNFSSTPGS